MSRGQSKRRTTTKKRSTSKKRTTSKSRLTSKERSTSKVQIRSKAPDPGSFLSDSDIDSDSITRSISDTRQQLKVQDGVLFPSAGLAHKKTRKKSDLVKQNKIYDDYLDDGKIPLYYPSNSKDLIPVSYFKTIPTTPIVAEKPELLGKDEGVTVQGQQIQMQLFPTKEGDEYEVVGFYFQKSSGAKRDNPTPQLYKAKTIRTDNDSAGHYLAFWQNMYGHDDPFKQNVQFDGKGKLKSVDPNKVNHFIAESSLNSMSYKQSLAIQDAIKGTLGKKALTYRTAQGKRDDVKISEQVIHIVNESYGARELQSDGTWKRQVILEANLTDGKIIKFQYTMEEFKEKTPSLRYVPYKTEKVARLDSDTLLRAMVQKFHIEGDSAQNLLESLHNQGWITYPRSDVEKAEETPIRIVEGKDIEDFRGTSQEQNVLEMVKVSEDTFDKRQNFITQGYWVLKSGNREIKSKTVVHIAGDPVNYTDKEFDLRVADRGMTPEDLMNLLVEEQIGRPATRTAQLSRLKEAGILTLRKNHYQVDNRGLYFVAALEVMQETGYPTARELVRELDMEQSPEEMAEIVGQYRFIERKRFGSQVKDKAKDLIEEEHDLAYLESH